MSEPEYEHEHLRNLTFYSPALQGRGDVSLFVPPGLNASPRLPVLILLHGVYGSHWNWFLKGGAHRTALTLMKKRKIRPMLLVAPSDGLRGDGTAYVPGSCHNYEAWICDDLIECIKELFCTAAGCADVFISGLSMGGYGALRLGAMYPDRFCGISAHSAITKIEQFNGLVRGPSAILSASPESLDVLHWLILNCRKLPPLRFDCGRDDPLFDANCVLHEALERHGILHNFEINEGDHSWQYWRNHLMETLLFVEETLLKQRL
ncbi:MAG TPA: alpha/beta hydrolase-fold protein [Acidobacteriaceae bacterium]|nr:alpha/beta hydrolase-fold protein [Acidobacteriaceae bacterium]